MIRIPTLLACAAALAGAQPVEPADLVAKVLAAMRKTTRGIPNYACLETVTRDYYRALASVPRGCDYVVARQDQRPLDMQLRRVSTDRLRLDVAMTSRGEVHSWAGDTRFDDRTIDAIVHEGPMGTGAFGGFVATVFDQDVKNFRRVGESTEDGRRLVRFAFDVPLADSHYKVKAGRDWVATAYTGSFEADADTGEVQWLDVRTAILPEAAVACQTSTRLDLGRTAIGAGEFLVTTRARQEFLQSDAGLTVNTIHFSGCREYRGESTISFATDGPLPSGNTSSGKAPPRPPEFPPELPFSLELRTPIDSTTAAAGDPFTARLDSPIRSYGETLAPGGSRVQGRILRVQTWYAPDKEVIIVLRPETVEVRGVRYPLTAIGDFRYVGNQQKPITKARKGAVILLPFRYEVDAGLFRFPGERHTLKRGWLSHWVTAKRAQPR